MLWVEFHAEFVVAAAETSHVRKLSSGDLDVGWEGLGFVVVDALVEAVVQDPEEAVGEVTGSGAVGVCSLAASVVVGAGSG
jgi:hypothetical protein